MFQSLAVVYGMLFQIKGPIDLETSAHTALGFKVEFQLECRFAAKCLTAILASTIPVRKLPHRA